MSSSWLTGSYPQEITIRNAKIVRTGPDGGDACLQGSCTNKGEEVAITALMANAEEESKLLEGDLVVTEVFGDELYSIYDVVGAQCRGTSPP